MTALMNRHVAGVSVATVILIAGCLGGLAVFAVDLRGIFTALAYLAIVILMPGSFLIWLASPVLARDGHREFDWRTTVPLITLFGIATALISYLSAQWTDTYALNLLFLAPYATLLHPHLWRDLARKWRNIKVENLPPTALMVVVFMVAVGFPIFMMRPTPGLMPTDIFHDHLWTTSNTVALVNDYPLQSLNIESRPVLAYHILVQVIGAHMALVTGMVPHLIGLQYVYAPLVVLLVLNVVAVFDFLLEGKKKYIFYGTAVTLFGSGFALVHDVQVAALLESSSTLVGVIILFAWIGVAARAADLTLSSRFLFAFVALLLATVAKGPVGAALAGGYILWALYRSWKRRITVSDLSECSGALIGFAVSYLLFFSTSVIGAENMPAARELLEGRSFAVTPLAYVTQNALAGDLVRAVETYLQGGYAILGLVVLTLVILPLYVVLYFSYRLVPFFFRGKKGYGDLEEKLLCVTIAAVSLAYTVNGSAIEHAHFLAPGLFALDVLFVFWVWRISLFEKLASRLRRNLFAFIGMFFVLTLPFAGVSGWVRSEYTKNFVTFGHIGRALEEQLRNTAHRQSRSQITPDLYSSLQYIRTSTEPSSVVVTPFITIADGRPLSFLTSAFSERAAYLEGYGFGVVRAAQAGEIADHERVVTQLYEQYSIDEALRQADYVILADASFVDEVRTRWRPQDFAVVYENSTWAVLRLSGFGAER